MPSFSQCQAEAGIKPTTLGSVIKCSTNCATPLALSEKTLALTNTLAYHAAALMTEGKKSFISLTVGLILQNLNPCYIRPHLPLNLCSKSTFIASSRCCCNIQTVLTVELHLFHMGPLKNVETLSITNSLSSPYNTQTVFTVEIHLFQMGTPKEC
jgi:hypothetical protein